MCFQQSVRLASGVAAPKLARDAVRGWLHDWDLGELVEDALPIVSELVTNASVHAATAIEVSLSADPGAVHLIVRDQDPRPPILGIDPGPSGGGRGLIVVDGLADAWGATPLPGGKEVWVRLTPPAAWRHRDTCPRRAQH